MSLCKWTTVTARNGTEMIKGCYLASRTSKHRKGTSINFIGTCNKQHVLSVHIMWDFKTSSTCFVCTLYGTCNKPGFQTLPHQCMKAVYHVHLYQIQIQHSHAVLY